MSTTKQEILDAISINSCGEAFQVVMNNNHHPHTRKLLIFYSLLLDKLIKETIDSHHRIGEAVHEIRCERCEDDSGEFLSPPWKQQQKGG